jgi:hypothetical protein
VHKLSRLAAKTAPAPGHPQCLASRTLLAMQIGTGVMVGLPGQTLRDLAGDILFFRDLGADMIGMVCVCVCVCFGGGLPATQLLLEG